MKKAATLMLTALLALSTSVFTFAASPTITALRAGENTSAQMILDGKVQDFAQNQEVTIIVAPTSADYTDDTKIAYINQFPVTDVNGNFSISFYLRDSLVEDQSYTLRVGGTDVSTVGVATFTYHKSGIVWGDFNNDGKLSIFDASELLLWVQNSNYKPTTYTMNFEAAKVNGSDKSINTFSVAEIKLKVQNPTYKFMVERPTS